MTKVVIFFAIGMIIGLMFTGYGVVGKIRNKHDDLGAAMWCWMGVLIVNTVAAITSILLKYY